VTAATKAAAKAADSGAGAAKAKARAKARVDETALLRARSQHLTDATAIAGSAHDLVVALGAIQAQSMPSVVQAFRPRSRGLTAGAVSQALNRERSIVRTWAMRGTLHLLPAEDVGWIVSLLGPIFAARGRNRRRQLGVDDRLAERAVAVIRSLLKGGPRTRAELIDGMARRGIAFETRSQGPIHLIALAAMRGVLVYGPEREGEDTFVLLEDWIGAQRPVSPEKSARELARRYLLAHAPADVADFAVWSGLPVRMAREAAGAAAPPPLPSPPRGRVNSPCGYCRPSTSTCSATPAAPSPSHPTWNGACSAAAAGSVPRSSPAGEESAAGEASGPGAGST
jgi:winged helix DNA-binding protein